MRDDEKTISEAIDLGAASELTQGIPENDAVEQLYGQDFKD